MATRALMLLCGAQLASAALRGATEDNSTQRAPANATSNKTTFPSEDAARCMGEISTSASFAGDALRHLRYTIWMDQFGDYGSSSLDAPSEDALVLVAQKSKANASHEIGTDGVQRVGKCNEYWSWYNKENVSYKPYKENVTGHGASNSSQSQTCTLLVTWNHDRTFGLITNYFDPVKEALIGLRLELELQPWWKCHLLNSSDDCQAVRDANIICPPPAGSEANSDAINSCAMWKRSSYVACYHWMPKALCPRMVYYAFPVLDDNKLKVQPYFDRYANALAKRSPTGSHFGHKEDRDDVQAIAPWRLEVLGLLPLLLVLLLVCCCCSCCRLWGIGKLSM